MKSFFGKSFFIFTLLFLLISVRVLAFTPFYVNAEGAVVVWDTSSSIQLSTEAGSCSKFSNSEMIDKFADETNGIAQWGSVDLNEDGKFDVDLTFDILTGVIKDDITEQNLDTVYSTNSATLTDGINPIIFDDTGEIVDAIFGNANHFIVLGFAGPDTLDNSSISLATTITAGSGVFNCACIKTSTSDGCEVTADDVPDLVSMGIPYTEGLVVPFTETDLEATIVHEIGHFLGLSHSPVNDDLQVTPCDLDTDDCDALPTMYPIITDSADQLTLSRDDKVGILTLYGKNGWQDDYCTVVGTVLDTNGDPLRCASVEARADDDVFSVGEISGGFAPAKNKNVRSSSNPTGDYDTQDAGECLSDCGDFTLAGLKPGKKYTIQVRPISSDFVAGSAVPPCDNGQLDDVVEETLTTITAKECVAGKTINIGSVTTSSKSGLTDGGEKKSSSSGIVSCALNSHQPVSLLVLWMALLPVLLFCGFYSCLSSRA